MKVKSLFLSCIICAFLLLCIEAYGIEGFEIGCGVTYRQPGNTYFRENSDLPEMSYYGDLLLNNYISIELAYYSRGSYLMYYYRDDPLQRENWSGPYYRTESPSSAYYINMGNAQMHIFDIRFRLRKNFSKLNLFAEIGPTVIIPGRIIGSSNNLNVDFPEGWYEILQDYTAQTGGFLPIFGANAGAGIKLSLWHFALWSAARCRYTWGVPDYNLLQHLELSFGAGVLLYRKK